MSTSDNCYLVISDEIGWNTGYFGIDCYEYKPEYHNLILMFIDKVKDTVGHEYSIIKMTTEKYTADVVAAFKRLTEIGMTINFHKLTNVNYTELKKVTECNKCSDPSLLVGDDRFDNVYRMKCIHS